MGDAPTDALRKLKENHPDLYRRGLPLWEQGAGAHELAWKKADVLNVIAALERDGQCILGGDVWEVTEGRAMPLYANWYYLPTGEPSDSFDSKDLADRWVESYSRTEDTIRFSLVWRPA